MVSCLKRFWQDRGGNFAVITTLIITPVLATIGIALDVNYALEVRTRLMGAADAAAVGAVSAQSPGVTAALAMPQDGRIEIGEQDARHLFSGNVLAADAALLTSVKVELVKSGNALTSHVTFAADVPTSLLRIIDRNIISVGGSAQAVYSTGKFIDFYMLLDNTPSMGVGATETDIATMVRNTPDSCAFACHESKSDNYYNLAKSLNVQMRIDTVRQATQQLTVTAGQTMAYPQQFRFAVYSFGRSADTAQLTEVAPLSADMAAVKTATADLDLMTTVKNNYKSNELTDLDAAFTSLGAIIKTGGTGDSSTNREKIIFFVSDGVTDSGKGSDCTKPVTGTRCQEPIDYASLCPQIKRTGIKIAVLYTTYLPLPDNDWYNNWIKPFQSQIATNMAACASPGLYFEVSPTQGISEAMHALFQRIVSSPRISG